jgi:hypothetical protein
MCLEIIKMNLFIELPGLLNEYNFNAILNNVWIK